MTISVPGLSNVPVIGFTKRMVFPGQDTVKSRYTGRAQVIGRGPGLWAGSITWAPTSVAHVRSLDQLFLRLEGQVESVRLRLPRTRYAPDHPVPSGVRVATAAELGERQSDGTWGVHVSVTDPDFYGGTILLSSGQHINIRDRLYVCAETVSFSSVSVFLRVRPGRPFRISNILVRQTVEINTPFVIVRAATPGQGLLSHTGNFNDPVVFQWEEAI